VCVLLGRNWMLCICSIKFLFQMVVQMHVVQHFAIKLWPSVLWMGRHSSVGTANRYGLDGPAIKSRWKRGFPHPSRPAWRSTLPLLQWVTSFSGGKAARMWRWPPTLYSVDVKERVGLYLFSHFEPSWHVLWRNFLFTFRFVTACSLLVATSSCLHR